jgi:hypothetical protein
MQAISTDQRNLVYQKELHISWKKPEGGAKLVILNLNDGDFFSLEDPVSIEIWEKLMAGQTPAAVFDHLTRSYSGEEPAALGRDMDGFVGELLANRLICPCSPSASA